MQIPIYQSRVGPATQLRDTTPRRQESAYEGIIQFSDALKQVGGQVTQIALDNERRVRAQTMQAESSRAWRDYSEFKKNFNHQYFDPQNANTIDPETGLPMYVVGMRRLQEESGKFATNAAEHFTYSDALQNFQQNFQQDMVQFSDAIRSQGRALHLGVLRHQVSESVEDAIQRRDPEVLRQELDTASETGTISPQERANLGNRGLHDIAYRKVMEQLRQSIWEGGSPAGIEELMEIVNEAGRQEYEDMGGEQRRLTGEDLENLRTLARQERGFRIQDDAWRRGEEDRVSNEHGQRDFRNVMSNQMTTSQMRMKLREADSVMGDLPEGSEYRGMSAQTREHWHRALDGLEGARATEAGEIDARNSMMGVHAMVLQGHDQQAINWEIWRLGAEGEITEPQMRTLMNHNASRNLNDNMKRFDNFVERVGREQGASAAEIFAAQMGLRDLLMENAYITQDGDGRNISVENWNPQEVMHIAENYLRNFDWQLLGERQFGPEMAGGLLRDTFQRFNVGHEVQEIIDNDRLLGIPFRENPEIMRVLSAQGEHLRRSLTGALGLRSGDPSLGVFIDDDGRAILSHSHTTRGGGAVTRTFTYFNSGVKTRDDGTLRAATLELHMLGPTGQWQPVPDAYLDELRRTLGTAPVQPGPSPNVPPVDLPGATPQPIPHGGRTAPQRPPVPTGRPMGPISTPQPQPQPRQPQQQFDTASQRFGF